MAGGHSDREASLNRLTLAVGVAVLALGIAVAAITAPAPSQAAPSASLIAKLRAENASLRTQLAAERAAHRRTRTTVRPRNVTTPRDVRRALTIAAATYGVSEAKLRRVATCESTLNPNARNGRYLGLFQFGLPLWNATPYGDFSRADPYAASLAAAWAFKRGMQRHWPVCGRR